MAEPTDDDWKRMSKLVDTFIARPDAEPFREPVDYKALGLDDYPEIVKNPMDLGTVKEKLKSKQYRTLFQVGDDVRLVWTNCMTYNQDGSDFYKLADLLHRKWDEKYAEVLNKCVGGGKAAAAGEPPMELQKASLADKRNFAKELFKISKEDLGRVLVELESKCPAAIKRNSTEDEVELNVDKISPALLAEMSLFVNGSKAKKKKVTNNNSKKQ